MFITKDTISTVTPTTDGKYILKFYRDCKTVFIKEYKTFTGAKIAESKLMKKYYF